ncbi:MAG TPA: PilZ domain-containing protein [Candidatus Aminicenantes bacterium]|nr:PilZ domain-containing protein [Candidatus Aminicenantes bacterium]
MRDRDSRRKDERKEVVIRDGDRSFSCKLLDVSATGISVAISHFIPTYKEIGVVMEIDGKPVAMKGSVRWSIDPAAEKGKKGKLGVFIIKPPREFLDFAEKISGTKS